MGNLKIKDNIEKLLEKLQKVRRPESEKIGRERISAVYEGKECDHIPILVDRPAHTINYSTEYSIREQFFSKEKMLYETLKRMIEAAKIGSDGQLCIRANLGTVLVPSLFGLSPIIPEDTMPWCKEHLSKKEIVNFHIPEGLSGVGLMGKALDYMAYFRQRLGDLAHVYLPDTQGPFDIAHLVYGDDIFTEIYDDPGFVHHLLELCTEMYIRATKVLKEALGEPEDSGYHGHGMSVGIYMSRGGARVSEDTPILLSPRHIQEFVIPYDRKALVPFKGGFIHFCGENLPLAHHFLRTPEVRGINLGNPETYDEREFMKKTLAESKFYFGSWKRKEGESLLSYFRRVISFLNGTRGGMIFLLELENLRGEEAQFVVSLWREVQDE